MWGYPQLTSKDQSIYLSIGIETLDSVIFIWSQTKINFLSSTFQYLLMIQSNDSIDNIIIMPNSHGILSSLSCSSLSFLECHCMSILPTFFLSFRAKHILFLVTSIDMTFLYPVPTAISRWAHPILLTTRYVLPYPFYLPPSTSFRFIHSLHLSKHR